MGNEAVQEAGLRPAAGPRHLLNLRRIDRHDIEYAVADETDLTAVDLHDDDNVQRRRLGQALAEATTQIDDRNDGATQIEDAAYVFRLFRQMRDVGPTFDLTHGHDVHAVLVVADGEADKLVINRAAGAIGRAGPCIRFRASDLKSRFNFHHTR